MEGFCEDSLQNVTDLVMIGDAYKTTKEGKK
jgi:hypothetical protein